MSCQLEPTTLGFHRPLTTLVKKNLTVSNNNDRPIIFKVKTTAPKQYCVRPNSGRVEPGEKVEVQVLLQPMKEDPPTGTKCRDKFLVQSAFVPPESVAFGGSFTEIWQSIEKTSKSEIAEQKIRCTYLPALDSSIPEDPAENANETLANENMSSFAQATTGSEYTNAREEEDTRYSTIRTSLVGVPNEASDPPAVSLLPTSEVTEEETIAEEPSAILPTPEPSQPEIEEEPKPEIVVPQSSKTNGISYSVEYVEKLKEKYELEIERLKSELNEGLRRRNLPDTTEVKEKVVAQLAVAQQKTGTQGVPPHVVAALVVGVFLITWLFF